jgi:hypothetical protein
MDPIQFEVVVTQFKAAFNEDILIFLDNFKKGMEDLL